jgi:hypothetical protein
VKLLISSDTGASGYGCGEAIPISRNELCAFIRADELPQLTRNETFERSPAICYACCAIEDIQFMDENGKATLYLTDNMSRVSNWLGSLNFLVYHVKKSRHNIARFRYDVWFYGPDGFIWHGVQYGDNTQICHCRRTKKKSRIQ